MKNKKLLIVLLIVCSLPLFWGIFQIVLISFVYGDEIKTINDCIKKTNKEYQEIQELVCVPGEFFSFPSRNYKLLSKLTNLESISITGIRDDEASQLFLDELARLNKLTSIEIIDSNISGSMNYFAKIKNLSSLSIESCRIGQRSKVDDLNFLLSSDNDFKNLKELKLQNLQIESFPDMRNLTNLESLTIHKFDSNLNYDYLNWNKLTSLDISYTNIDSIDEKIINSLYNLEVLDISSTKIEDIQFVLKLTKLKEFRYYNHEKNNIDMELLKKHPNFNDSWLKN